MDSLSEEQKAIHAGIEEAIASGRPFTPEEQKYIKFARIACREAEELRRMFGISEDVQTIINRKDINESPVIKKIEELKAKEARLRKELEELKCTGKKS